MFKAMKKTLSFLTILMVSIVLFGCNISINSNGDISGAEEYSYSQDKIADNEAVDLKLDFGAGELKLSSTNTQLIDSHFLYSHKNLKPEINIRESALTSIEIKHSGRVSTNLKNFVNKWDIQLQEQLSYNMEFNLGVGSTTLDLSNFNDIKGVKIETGVGESIITLSSNPVKGYTVDVEAGIGQTTIYYPEQIGIAVKTKQGLGSTSLKGLSYRSDLDAHVNDAYDQSDVIIELSIQQGIGEVSINPIK